MNLDNLRATFTSTDVTTASTVIGVADPSQIPAVSTSNPAYFTITPVGVVANKANSEIVRVTGISDSNVTIVRAQRGTTAKAFQAGALFYMGLYVQDVAFYNLSNVPNKSVNLTKIHGGSNGGVLKTNNTGDVSVGQIVSGNINWTTIFPIGELKYFAKNVNPNTLYPGTTWTRRTGYFLWAGADSGDYSVGKTFGSSTHTLTIAEMPSHRHSIGWNNGGGYLPANNSWASSVNVRNQINYSFSDRWPNGHNDTEFLSYTGGSKPHNNMPPAKSVYLWERTA